MRCCVLLWCAVLVCVGNRADAADIEIVGSGAAKSEIDVSGITHDESDSQQLFVGTLRSDLDRSGWFVRGGRDAVIRVTGVCANEPGELVFDGRVVNRATGELYLNKRFAAVMSEARKLAHEVSDAIVYAVKGEPGIASTRIVMIGAHGSGKDIYMCDADGGNIVRITKNGAVCLSPDWSPDGTWFTYTSFHRGFPDVYRVDLGSGRRDRIVNFPGLNAGGSIAPDGRRIALTLSKDGNPDLYAMTFKNSRVTRLTRTPHAAEASPSWSPDGKSIVFVSDSSGSPQLYVLSARGGQAKRLTFRGRENVAPDWGPGGKIAFSRRQESRYDVFLIDPATGEERQLTSDGADYEDPSWARDGRHIVCSRTEAYRSSLYVLDTLGDPPLRLTTLSGDWYSPDWSPR